MDYRNGTGGVIASDSKAAQQFILAAELGHAKAQGELGSLYAVGAGVPLDRTEAVRWYRLGAAQGDGAALWGLGLAYQNGSGGLEKNDFEAVRWFQKSADVGYIQGQRSLAEAYEAGIGGLQRDDLQALYWFRKAAAQDSQASTYAIAMMYRDGRGGLARNNDQYVMWLRKAASLDHPDAKADLRRLGLSQ